MTQLLTVGETMLRVSPPPGEALETARDVTLRAAGAESNVGVTASNLGVDVVWWSRLPASPLGRRVVRELHQYGLETQVRWSETGRQGLYFLEQGGRPRGPRVIYDRGATPVREATFEQLAADVAIADVDVVFTTGITQALSPPLRSLVSDLFEAARAAEVTTAFDLNYHAKLWDASAAREAYTAVLPLVDIAVIARKDAEAVLEASPGTADATLLEQLQSTHGCRQIILTVGDRGAMGIDAAGEIVEAPALPTDTFDPIGTGDAFVGAVLAAVCGGASLEAALEDGVAAAAIKRTYAGDLAVIDPDLLAAVKRDASDRIDR